MSDQGLVTCPACRATDHETAEREGFIFMRCLASEGGRVFVVHRDGSLATVDDNARIEVMLRMNWAAFQGGA